MPSERRNPGIAGSPGTAELPLALDPCPPPRSGLEGALRATRRWWKEQTARRIEDGIAGAGSSPGASRFVLPLIAPILVVPAILVIREPENYVAAATLACGVLALVFALICDAVEQRVPNAWISLVNPAVNSLIISALLLVFVVVDHPRDHAHWIIFFLYFLLIGSSGMSNDPRQPICAGAFSILGYLGVVLLLAAELAGGGSAMAREVAAEFEWVANSAKVGILAGATIVAAASSRRGRDLRRSSLRDGLTGLLNRHAFDQCLERLALDTRQQGGSLTVAMIDIDHFKRLNDTYGHPAGDEVLLWVAGWLLRSFRATDLVARYGGEEFVVAFPGCHDDRILQRLQALQRGISEAAVRSVAVGGDLCVSVSIGAARMPEDADAVYEVLSLADQRLYAAKRRGRDQVVVSG